ncbi:MAG: hypothetical protein KKD56_00555 [Acidobacteria bacterium]|nr:hypothetical protein [Acidobacteriota bacterium]MCG2815123.1 hypothetical protein [Candidatus Aminicenantes bacterium]MBU1337537.1 hypothetical protein [Acidobacteriota bacterium]MBU1474524.1 hypothetical protein [Acidobacteriota bacterium]MBU4255154.1 hypothetical protein [Acidobacteriota bacterium]
MTTLQKPGFFMPALIGGGIAGVLSGIPIINCLCCLWIIGGAVLASYLLLKDAKVPLTAGDGAVVGALTGLIATFVDTLVSIPFNKMSEEFLIRFQEKFAEYAKDVPEGWEEFLQRGFDNTGPWILVGILITAVIFVALGALGGIIGISLFQKKRIPQGTEDATIQDTSHR